MSRVSVLPSSYTDGSDDEARSPSSKWAEWLSQGFCKVWPADCRSWPQRSALASRRKRNHDPVARIMSAHVWTISDYAAQPLTLANRPVHALAQEDTEPVCHVNLELITGLLNRLSAARFFGVVASSTSSSTVGRRARCWVPQGTKTVCRQTVAHAREI